MNRLSCLFENISERSSETGEASDNVLIVEYYRPNLPPTHGHTQCNDFATAKHHSQAAKTLTQHTQDQSPNHATTMEAPRHCISAGSVPANPLHDVSSPGPILLLERRELLVDSTQVTYQLPTVRQVRGDRQGRGRLRSLFCGSCSAEQLRLDRTRSKE